MSYNAQYLHYTAPLFSFLLHILVSQEGDIMHDPDYRAQFLNADGSVNKEVLNMLQKVIFFGAGVIANHDSCLILTQ
jgi:hypothetical protein